MEGRGSNHPIFGKVGVAELGIGREWKKLLRAFSFVNEEFLIINDPAGTGER